MTSLTIFSTDSSLKSNWQGMFPRATVTVTDSSSSAEGVRVFDCSHLDTDRLKTLIKKYPSCSFALLDKESLIVYGALLMDAEIPILKSPLDAFGKQVIQDALDSLPAPTDKTPDTRPKTFSNLAKEIAFHSNNPKELIGKIAGVVRETMRADWVAFVSVKFDENNEHTVDILGMVGEVDDRDAEHVIRRDGHTIHIMKSQFPLLMPDIQKYNLSGIDVNPRTIESGFKAGLGLPLLLEDGKPFGVMWVMYRHTRHFTYEEVRHMQMYASHVALAYNYPVQKKLVDQWQKAAQRIFTRAGDSSSLETNLQHITDGIHDSLDCDVVMLYLYHPVKNEVSTPFSCGLSDAQPSPLNEHPVADSIVYEMLDEKAPLIFENAPADKRFGQTEFLKREGIQSIVVMPLKRANEKVGVIFLNYRNQRHFTDDEREAITHLTDQIAVPVLNARLDEEQRATNLENIDLIKQLNEQGEQLQTLVKVIDIERNLSTQDRDAILNMIASRTAEASGADRVTIRLIHGEEVGALAVYPHSQDESGDDTANREIREGGHSHYIVKTNRPVIIDDVDNYDPSQYNNIQINPAWRGVWKARIGLPLTSGEQTIGVMWLSFKKARQVTDTQLTAFQSFANIAFLTKMYDIEQERLRKALNLMLNETYQSINVSTETDKILHHTMELARRIVSSQDNSAVCRSHIAIVHNRTLSFKPAHNDPSTYALLQKMMGAETTIALEPDATYLVAHAAINNEIILVNDVSHDNRFTPLLHDEHSGSQISVPIRVGDKVFAIISIEHKQANSFEWHDRDMLEWLASFVGQVIRNRKQQQMRDALVEASRAITEGMDLQSVLQGIAEHAHRVIQVKRGETNHDAYVGLREGDKLIFFAGYPGDTLKSIERAGLREIDLNQDLVGISGLALLNNEDVMVDDTGLDSRAFEVENADFPPLSLMAVPIPNLTEDQPAVGVISLGHREIGSFDNDDKEIILLLAKFAAVAIRRAQEIDAQEVQRESLFELTHAAMNQVIASHDLYNFRMIYKLEFPRLRSHAETLIDRKNEILKTINDSRVFDDIEGALRNIQANINNLDDAYQSLIERDAQVPELGDVDDFQLREWLWMYHKENDVHLQIDSSLKESYRCEIPRYWLREVIKIVITNARRALEKSDLSRKGEKSSERLIKMLVVYKPETQQVDIQISNPGTAVPPELRSLLTQRIIPGHLRKRGDGGRGIGLFMSGVIMRAYNGDIRYLDTGTDPTFVLSVPVK